ncbi:MAG TPA: nucleoside hydrolase [Syntrophomonadaceae bacterium]|nr:nucleoside hydrolase [Syntrophomonadaceae bacterium]
MKKILFDCDNTMGVEGCDVDDGLALLYLLGIDFIEICGITTTYGNSDINTVYTNTKRMLQEIDQSDIPLLKGCPNKDVLNSDAVDFILETVNKNKGNISILATGSLTNLYAAFLKDSTLFEKTSELVIMGGITEDLIINGQVLDELNFSCDPTATECVLRNGKNVSVITGNNCLDAFFTEKEFNDRLLSSLQPRAEYISRKCKYWFRDMMAAFNINGFHNWDVVAAAFITNPSLFTNHFIEISPTLEDLRKGLLNNEIRKDELEYTINFPTINNIDVFTEDVYNAWLGLDRNYFF